MKLKVLIVLICFIICNEGKKTYRSRSTGSGRGTSRKTNAQPVPTSLSYPQPSAPKPTLVGWQSKPSSNSQSHSYPATNTGLSGNNNMKQPSSYQESYPKSNVPVQQTPTRAASPSTNNQQSHSYPSGGLSGNSGTGNGYPQQSKVGQPGSGQASASGGGYPVQQGTGLSGSTGGGYPQQQASGVSGYQHQQSVGLGSSGGTGYPQQHGTGLSNYGAAPPPYSGYKPGAQTPNNNYGNNYYHPQGPPPPYNNHAPSYGGFSGPVFPNSGYNPQMPGYFGNYANSGRGFGGMSRSRSALTGVGIAGAGVGTLLTGLALWNLARSTGQRHHTVIYDNRGQPVAVAPANNDTSAVDSMLTDLVNCSLTISTEDKTEVLAIPCAIATSFSPEANLKDTSDGNLKSNDTKCTVSVLTKTGQEFMTTIPCSILLNSAAENNVSEPQIITNETDTATGIIVPTDDKMNSNPLTPIRLTDVQINNNNTVNCTVEQPGEIRDPINPCFVMSHNLTVIPLQSTGDPDNKNNVGMK